jgi:hypothetical protein
MRKSKTHEYRQAYNAQAVVDASLMAILAPAVFVAVAIFPKARRG